MAQKSKKHKAIERYTDMEIPKFLVDEVCEVDELECKIINNA